MARELRVQYPGAVYHVMNRGDRREPIFSDDQDRLLFLTTLGEACEKTDWQVHAWCLMGNHFHLVSETPRGNLVPGMQWLLGVYTNRFNHRHKEFGHLFSGRYKALHVDGSGNGYLKAVCDYVHLNPVRAGLIAPEQPLQTYPWSSYPLYLQEPAKRPTWLRVDRLLGEWGIPQDSPAGREQFAGLMEARRRAERAGEYEPKGWFLDSEKFRQELLAQVSELATPQDGGEEIRESALAKAERMAQEELKALGWGAQDLTYEPRGLRSSERGPRIHGHNLRQELITKKTSIHIMNQKLTAPIVALLTPLLLLTLAGCSSITPERRDLATIKQQQAAITPAQVLEQLQRGNERFASGKPEPRDMLHDQRTTAAGQYPHAVILSCIDSRAPAEFIFDAGIGDLFNARIAGNIADNDLVGSMEFACKLAGAKLVVVMGHTSCGAIKGACDGAELGNLTGLLDKIKPAVVAVHDVPGERNSKNVPFVDAVAEKNVQLTVERIRELSPILREMESEGKIQIVGCVYDVETGRVRFLSKVN